MGKKSSSPPPAPDPYKTAAAQAQADKEAAVATLDLSALDQYAPWGSTTFQRVFDKQYGRKVPRSQTITLSPEQQRLYDRQTEIANRMAWKANERTKTVPDGPFTLAGLPSAPNRRGYGLDRQRVERELYDRSRNLLRPDMELESERFEQSMANRGLPLGGGAYNNAYRQFKDSQDRVLQGLAADAVRQGGAEQSRLFGLDSNARDRAVQERLLARTQDANEVAALLGGSPALPMPNYAGVAAPAVAAPDVQGAINQKYQADLNAYNARQQNAAATMQGIFGLGTALFRSSKSLKQDDGPPERILDGVRRLSVRSWRYRPETGLETEPHIGPYAEDWREIFGLGDGQSIHVVDAIGVCLQAIKDLGEEVRVLKAQVTAP